MVQISLARGWHLDIERGPHWLFVRPHRQNRTGSNSPAFAQQVWSILEQNFTSRLVLELADFERLDKHLVGELVWLYERIQSHDGMLRICGLSSENQRLLADCRLEERFQLCRDREEAVMGKVRPVPAP